MCPDEAAGILWRRRLHEHLAVPVRSASGLNCRMQMKAVVYANNNSCCLTLRSSRCIWTAGMPDRCHKGHNFDVLAGGLAFNDSSCNDIDRIRRLLVGFCFNYCVTKHAVTSESASLP